MKNILSGKLLFWFGSSILLCQGTNAEPNNQHGKLRADSCESISGIYQAAGEYFPSSSLPVKARMDWVLFLREIAGKPTGIELTWNGLGSLLEVKIKGENFSPPESINFSIGAKCEGGEVTYYVEHKGYSEGGSKNQEHLKARLSKDETGNLIFNGQAYIESVDLVIFKRSHKSEINAKFFPYVTSK